MNDAPSPLAALRAAVPAPPTPPVSMPFSDSSRVAQPPYADRGGFAWPNTPPSPVQPPPTTDDSLTPFDFIPSGATSGSQVTAKVNPQSFILAGSDVQPTVNINNLSQAQVLTVGKLFWLEGDLGNGNTYSIQGGTTFWDDYPAGGAYTGTGDTQDPFVQTYTYWPIALCVDKNDQREGKVFTSPDGSQAVKVLQITNTHLRVIVGYDSSKTLITLLPAPKPVPSVS